MSEKEFSGYKGEAREAIEKAEVEIGDMIRIMKNGEVYEGILIPRSEYGDEKHIVIKLKSGYNVGIPCRYGQPYYGCRYVSLTDYCFSLTLRMGARIAVVKCSSLTISSNSLIAKN